jgi:hypothetical protein
MNVQGDQAPPRRQKMLRKFENSSTKINAEQTVSSQTQLGSVMEFARSSENLNMLRIAGKSVPQLLTNVQKQWCINMYLEL